MRKSLKRKSRSCGLCKPNKIGWDSRWKPRESFERRFTERQIRERAFD